VRREGATTIYTQRALFHPHGLLGHMYWWAIWPFHGAVLRNDTQHCAGG
jgi:Protein of unknown function (DUF2867)